MKINAVIRLMNEHDIRLWRVIHYYVERARARTDLTNITRVEIDEIAEKSEKKYISLFVDIDRARVILAIESKNAAIVAVFDDDLTEHEDDQDDVAEV